MIQLNWIRIRRRQGGRWKMYRIYMDSMPRIRLIRNNVLDWGKGRRMTLVINNPLRKFISQIVKISPHQTDIQQLATKPTTIITLSWSYKSKASPSMSSNFTTTNLHKWKSYANKPNPLKTIAWASCKTSQTKSQNPWPNIKMTYWVWTNEELRHNGNYDILRSPLTPL